ncbi:S8 family serine peptidase [Neobacillus sp. FSL H8-0543]|uniref:S8 family serine peptidase n=1 Tax=Neobacillus sp. FSL H8-0543 TaxID=2954672 RepID=UPI0031592975
MYRKKTLKWLVSFLTFSLIISSAFTNIGAALGTTAFAGKKDEMPSSKKGNTRNAQADELIVKFKNTTSAAKLKTKHSLKTNQKLKSIGAEVVKVAKGSSVSQLMKTLKADPSVLYVQPNYTYTRSGILNDPSFTKLWGLDNTGQVVNGRPGVADVDIDYSEAIGAFTNVTNPQQMVVAVIDTGIDIHHPDLRDNIWVNPGEVANNGVDDDGNGYIDDINGWDFYHSDQTVFDPQDLDDHGTHVAGTIAAKSNNGIGITGIAANVKILPLKFLGPDGDGYTSDAILAIEYAESMGVKIANLSWSGSEYDQALNDVIDQTNMLFIAAAGNDGLNVDQQPEYPASFESTNIISVTAIDNSGNLADFSNYGYQNVDIAAPGVNILSTVPIVLEQGVAAEIFNPSQNYKAIFNGIGFEYFNATDRQAVFNKATNYLGLTSSSTILLVQDDEADVGNINYLPVYTSLLTNAGLSYNVKTVSAYENGPDLATLTGYDAVIWFSGNAMGQENPNLTSEDLSSLEQFLKRGNTSLLLSGQDLLYRNEDTFFVTDTLALSINGEGESRAQVTGVKGTTYDGASYRVKSAPYVDYITSNNSAIAKVNLLFPGDTNYDNAYSYYQGTSMAAPHVTGVAALLAGKHPDWEPEKWKNTILATGDSLASLSAKVQTGKTLNAAKALAYVQDEIAPSLPIVNIVTDKDTLVTGTAEAEATVEVKVNGSVIGTAVTGSDGTYSVTIPGQKADTVLVVTATDLAGNVSEATTVIVKDVTAPSLPIINIVADKDTLVTGTAEVGSTVQVKVNGSVIGSATAGADGNFMVSIAKQLAGTVLVVTVADKAGNVSEAATLTVVKSPATGWVFESGIWYYYDSVNFEKKTGWFAVGATWYYFNAKGEMQTGWESVGGVWYYFKSGGAMQTGWLQDGSTWYYFKSSGAMQTGWLQSSSTWYYFKSSGAMQTGWLQSGSTWYYFKGGGQMQTGWLLIGSTWYYFKPGGAMQTGWLQSGSTWFYFKSGGAMQTGWATISGKRYFFDQSGALK